MKISKVFIVLYWFWEGGGWLVNKYMDCFPTEKEAITFSKKKKSPNKLKIYIHNEKIPSKEDGYYGSPGFIQIIRKTF